MRDTKVLESFKKHTEKKLKEMNIFKHLKKEVNHGANGTQQYVMGTILMGLSTYVLMTIVELQVHVGMLTEEIMSIDKQIGRIYNHIDRMTSN